MPRIRSLKPGFFTSDEVAVLTIRARYTWMGLWCHVDDAGRCRDRAALIRAAVYPLDDVTEVEVERDLAELSRHGRIRRYTVGDKQYLEVTNFGKHQKPSHPRPSDLPAPPEGAGEGDQMPLVELPDVGVRPDSSGPPEASGNAPADGSTGEGVGEGVGGEGETRATGGTVAALTYPKQCPAHQHGWHRAPCGGCGEARRRWERDNANSPDADLGEVRARRTCGMCDSEGWLHEVGSARPVSPYERCDHSTDHKRQVDRARASSA